MPLQLCFLCLMDLSILGVWILPVRALLWRFVQSLLQTLRGPIDPVLYPDGASLRYVGATLGLSWEDLGAAWVHLGAILGNVGAILGILGGLGGYLGPPWVRTWNIENAFCWSTYLPPPFLPVFVFKSNVWLIVLGRAFPSDIRST